MRNVFDQYSQPENRLTHALATLLAMEPELCRGFLRWALRDQAPDLGRRRVMVTEQSLPGEPDLGEGEEGRSLPDACLTIGESWCLAIESKLTAGLDASQLRKHRRMVEGSFDHVEVLALTADPHPKVPEGVHHRTWADLFIWLGRPASQGSFWARQLREFLKATESKLFAKEVTLPGPLSTFDGIPFGPDHPYAYAEAKFILRQATEQLSRRKSLLGLGRQPTLARKAAITGRGRTLVWDVLSLAPVGRESKFTEFPHLTLSIHQDRVEAFVTFPNVARTRLRPRLKNLGRDGFLDHLEAISRTIQRLPGARKQAIPALMLLQRHYLTQQKGVEDARMRADLRTLSVKVTDGVNPQRTWAELAYDLFVATRGGNLQLQVGAEFPHDKGLLHGTQALDRIEATWLAVKPLLKALDLA